MEEVSISLMENHVESAKKVNGEEGKVAEVQAVAPAMTIAGEVKEAMEVMEVKASKVEDKDFKVVLEVKDSSKEEEVSSNRVEDLTKEVFNNKEISDLRKVGDL